MKRLAMKKRNIFKGADIQVVDAAGKFVKQFQCDSFFPAETVLFRVRFAPVGSLLAICDEEGFVSLADTYRNQLQPWTWRPHKNAVFDIAWTPDAKGLFVASGDQSLTFWNVERTDLPTRLGGRKGHKGSVRSVSVCPDNDNLAVSGGRDGLVLVWDRRNRVVDHDKFLQPVLSIPAAHPPQVPRAQRRSSTASRSVTAVLFHERYRILSAAEEALSGIRVWDIRKAYTNSIRVNPSPWTQLLRPQCVVNGKRQPGYSALCSDRSRRRLFAACTDSLIYEYSLSNFAVQSVAQYSGVAIDSYYVDVCCCPTLDMLLCGSSNGVPCIWDLSRSAASGPLHPRFCLKPPTYGLVKEITGVSWSSNGDQLVACDDCTWQLWSLPGSPNPRGGVQSEPSLLQNFTVPVAEKKIKDASQELGHLLLNAAPKYHEKTPPSSPKKPKRAEEVRRNQKRPLAFRSPFKSPSAKFLSPEKKQAKVIRPLVINRDRNPFHFKTPTQNLPDSVRDQKQKKEPKAGQKQSSFSRTVLKPMQDSPIKKIPTPTKKLVVRPKRQKEPAVATKKLQPSPGQAQKQTTLNRFFQKL